ncbi:MAG: glycoside hydrolase family 16 protein [Lentimicrobiaceae bacterium]|jgi:beta-glucanase (GH16 family)|nr:glycoside hydrolase family 16 protein [Lentimicrobiaceae bacterium]MDD4599325.1 glycoside hydrolase family 16 protein [Lentimicrobiaceae bacterium]MDY0026984.1 glycoside hydrolase family 16 protein [Lentimicrobium sp.]HAH57368.1 glycoside hydrolase [Bacteroidales bacterium]
MKRIKLVIAGMIFFTMGTVNAQNTLKLLWAEEFDYTGAPSPENWGYDTGDHGWGNNELQNYTANPENAFVKDGLLTIKAIKTGEKWTSARLLSKNKRDFKFGRIEVRAKLPSGVGTWPAIWMLPTEWVYGGWPQSGEIDIMEHVGYNPGVVHGTVHTKAYNHKIGTQVGDTILIPGFDKQFHVYAIAWDAEKIDFFVNDQKYFTFKNDHKGDFASWPFDQAFHLILNIAIGGDWGGVKGIDPNLEQAIMVVDYVRVYEI